MFTVSPSILSGNLLNLERQLDALAGLGNLHLDIDDGNFVRGISFGMDTVRAIVDYTDIPTDVHLEVLNPCDYVEELCRCGVKRLCAHIEALPYPSLFLSAARKGGAAACGLAVNLKLRWQSWSLMQTSWIMCSLSAWRRIMTDCRSAPEFWTKCGRPGRFWGRGRISGWTGV